MFWSKSGSCWIFASKNTQIELLTVKESRRHGATDPKVRQICFFKQVRELYLVPHALVALGEICVESEVKRAEELFTKARSYSGTVPLCSLSAVDYNFDKPLIRQIENWLDKLKASTSTTHCQLAFTPTELN